MVPCWHITAKAIKYFITKSLDHFQCYKPISSTASNDPKYFKQRSTKWFEVRKGIINASKAATSLGWYGKKGMTDYWNQLSNDLHGSQNEAVDHESNLAMLWGSMNEHSALVTYLNKFFSQSKHGATVKETGIWFLKNSNNQNWLGSSPDGIIEENGKLTTVLEMKCPFMGGKPVPYKKVCVNHIPQIMLQMCCTSTQQCHYIVWTPVGTKVFLIERDDKYLELLLNYLYKFWNLAAGETEPAWHEDVFGLKQMSMQIAAKSPCICFTSNSLITPDILSNDNIKKFEYNTKPLKQTTVTRKCQGCKDEEWKCKLNPCEVRRKRALNSVNSQQMSYQLYKYGSNGIHNSCHQDTFLELIYHSFKRQFDCSLNTKLTEGLKQLLEAFVLREKGKFHESKMTLWKWLRDKTESGFTYYAYGKEASLISIICRLLESMPGELRDPFSIKTNYSYTCGNDKSHNSCRSFTHSVFPISTDDVLETHLFLNSNDFDVIQVIKHKLTLNDFTTASKCSVLTKIDGNDICTSDSECTVNYNPNTCGATLLGSTSVTNTPDIFFVGYTHNSSKGYTPNLGKGNTTIEVNNCTYRCLVLFT